MKFQVTAIFLLAFAFKANCQTAMDPNTVVSDCRRGTQLTNRCNGGTCNTANGMCTCNAQQWQGSKCQIPISYQRDATNSCQCLNGGACYILRNQFTGQVTQRACDCHPAYRGSTCSQMRVSIACLDGTMTANVYPEYTDGLLYFDILNGQNRLISTSCRWSNLQAPGVDGQGFQAQDGYFLIRQSVDLTVPTGTCLAGRYRDQAGNICFDTRLGYSGVIRTQSDEFIKLCCGEDGNVIGGRVTVAIGNIPSTITATGQATLATARMEFTGTRTPVNRPVSIGEPISLAITPTPEARQRYQDFEITRCWFNGPNGADLNLVSNSCPVLNMNSVYRGITRGVDPFGNPIWYVNIAAFDFENSADVIMWCTIRPCTQASPCTGCSSGRKRRQAKEEEGGEMKEVSAKFSVFVTVNGDQQCKQCTEPQNCDLHDAFLPVAIVFAALLLMAVVAGVILCLKMKKRERNPRVEMSPAYYNSSVTKA